MRCLRPVAVLLALSALPRYAHTQGGEGFLFREPRSMLTVRTGWAAANARSDVFSFTTDQLTVNHGDFSSPAFDAEYTYRVLPRVQIAATLGVSSANKDSEFRRYVDNNDLPITQSFSFVRVPITVGVKAYLLPTGRTIGKYAWIPSRVAPYVGAGAGTMYYRFHQSGDFVDLQTLDVFPSQFESSGFAFTANGRAGAEYALGTHIAVTGEVRYVYARAHLARDFQGFEPIDLSGVSTLAGLAIRF